MIGLHRLIYISVDILACQVHSNNVFPLSRVSRENVIRYPYVYWDCYYFLFNFFSFFSCTSCISLIRLSDRLYQTYARVVTFSRLFSKIFTQKKFFFTCSRKLLYTELNKQGKWLITGRVFHEKQFVNKKLKLSVFESYFFFFKGLVGSTSYFCCLVFPSWEHLTQTKHFTDGKLFFFVVV